MRATTLRGGSTRGAHDPARPAKPRQSQVVDLPGLERVAPVRISDDVSEQIRRLIHSEQLDEGARLPSERDLAALVGASRPTVNQALRRLALMGLVEIRRGSGAYVLRRPQAMITASVNLMLDMDRESIGDLIDMRLWLETIGVEQAASQPPAGEAERTQLTEALRKLAEAEDASRWIAADTVFHAAIVAVAANPYLTMLYESVHTAVLTWEYDVWLKHGTEPEWLHTADSVSHMKLHGPIMDAVLARDPKAAAAAVLDHHRVMVEHLNSREASTR